MRVCVDGWLEVWNWMGGMLNEWMTDWMDRFLTALKAILGRLVPYFLLDVHTHITCVHFVMKAAKLKDNLCDFCMQGI